MKIKDYFKQAFTLFCKAVSMLAMGVFYAIRRLFTRYPNPTWMVIVACLVFYGVVKLADARSERDACNRKNAMLIQKMDSLMGKEVKYEAYK